MREEKAYKLLSVQEGISNNEAKKLIDSGLVYANGEKLNIARALVDVKTTFKVKKAQKESIIYEDENILVLNKPAFKTTEELAKAYKLKALHRLDKETSGVLILVKNEEFRVKAIEEFKHHRVQKIYETIVHGKIAEELNIDSPILTIKGKGGAYSKISQKGKEAISIITPLMIEGKNSKIQVEIKTGRTHQIRVHLASISCPVLGDMKYGKYKASRLMLHCKQMRLFNKTFTSPTPKDFNL